MTLLENIIQSETKEFGIGDKQPWGLHGDKCHLHRQERLQKTTHIMNHKDGSKNAKSLVRLENY